MKEDKITAKILSVLIEHEFVTLVHSKNEIQDSNTLSKLCQEANTIDNDSAKHQNLDQTSLSETSNHESTNEADEVPPHQQSNHVPTTNDEKPTTSDGESNAKDQQQCASGSTTNDGATNDPNIDQSNCGSDESEGKSNDRKNSMEDKKKTTMLSVEEHGGETVAVNDNTTPKLIVSKRDLKDEMLQQLMDEFDIPHSVSICFRHQNILENLCKNCILM